MSNFPEGYVDRQTPSTLIVEMETEKMTPDDLRRFTPAGLSTSPENGAIFNGYILMRKDDSQYRPAPVIGKELMDWIRSVSHASSLEVGCELCRIDLSDQRYVGLEYTPPVIMPFLEWLEEMQYLVHLAPSLSSSRDRGRRIRREARLCLRAFVKKYWQFEGTPGFVDIDFRGKIIYFFAKPPTSFPYEKCGVLNLVQLHKERVEDGMYD